MTASWFRQAFVIGDAALDAVYAEPITIKPMATPSNGRPAADPSRAVVTIQGIFDEPSTQDYPDARGHAASSSHQFSTTKPQVEFTTAAVPYTVRIGDIVVRPSTGDVFSVSDPGDDGFLRTVLKLSTKT